MESRNLPAPPHVPAEIEDLRRQVERWRQSRRHPEPMPARLWGSAAKLARKHGVARIARHARLDYTTGVCRRLEAHELQVLPAAGDPAATRGAPPRRRVSPAA